MWKLNESNYAHHVWLHLHTPGYTKVRSSSSWFVFGGSRTCRILASALAPSVWQSLNLRSRELRVESSCSGSIQWIQEFLSGSTRSQFKSATFASLPVKGQQSVWPLHLLCDCNSHRDLAKYKQLIEVEMCCGLRAGGAAHLWRACCFSDIRRRQEHLCHPVAHTFDFLTGSRWHFCQIQTQLKRCAWSHEHTHVLCLGLIKHIL